MAIQRRGEDKKPIYCVPNRKPTPHIVPPDNLDTRNMYAIRINQKATAQNPQIWLTRMLCRSREPGQVSTVIPVQYAGQLVNRADIAILAQVRCYWARGWTESNSQSYWVKEAQVQLCLSKSELWYWCDT